MIKIFFGVLSLLLISSCAQLKESSNPSKHKHTNALVNESSPYLLQHAHNPVDWYPWGDEALEKAKSENKMLLISIGYAACHWCHVMEHESFEDSLVSQIMNDNFVCIKVDREERPDVDDVYMTACQLASGRGCGWPLNAFALSDGRPVWAATYFPKDQWMKILDQFATMQTEDQSRLLDASEKITRGIAANGTIDINLADQSFQMNTIENASMSMIENIDPKDGGRKGAPKFPMPNNYEFLLKYYQASGDVSALDAVTLTLDKMANGGINDQLGGGFSRYSTDSYWLAPHFEKMMYDNGQLISLYSHAFQITKKPLYERVISETIEWTEREMLDQQGGYYASLDADSEGEEGKFYVWSKSEIKEVLTEEKMFEIFCDYYDVSEKGNWEHTNILFHDKSDKEISDKHNISKEELEKTLTASRNKLLKARSSRIRPALDDKILTSWNSLMITGLVDAYKALQDKRFLEKAIKAANFIVDIQLQKDFRLQRNYKDGKSAINGFLDDYATTIQAFISLYQVTLDKTWLDKAEGLQKYVDQHFINETHGMYNYTSDLDPPLVAQKSKLGDDVISSPSSMTARNLFYLGHYLYNEKYIEHSKQMLHNMDKALNDSKQVSFYSNWLQLYLDVVNPPYEVAVIGEDAPAKALKLQSQYMGNAIVLGSTGEENLKLLEYKGQEGKTFIYVCQNKACKMPTEDIEKARTLMKN